MNVSDNNGDTGDILHEFRRSWTRADLETACRQLGYQGGQWWLWIDRQWPSKPRLLYEEPGCRGIEPSLTTCERWSERELGAGVCGECKAVFVNFFLCTCL